MSIPGAFPEPTEDDSTTVQRTPRRRFVGRKALETKQGQGAGGSVEETTAIVQNSEYRISAVGLH